MSRRKDGSNSRIINSDAVKVWKVFVLRRKYIPNAMNENIVAERTTDGESPAIKANPQSESTTQISRTQFPSLFFGNAPSMKFTNNSRKPTCSPDTDKI